MNIHVKTASGGYEISFIQGGIHDIASLWGVGEKTLVVTDSGVPADYAQTVAACCKNARVFTFPAGEKNKNINTLCDIWRAMVDMELTRSDRVIAVGGGVVGDMAGLAAATYMRGIAFYNIPTTLLSQVDSSVGGKTAVDFENYKNIIGAFHQPRGVLIDVDTLKTLPDRQKANGLAEAVKMAATYDADLFSRFENEDVEDNLQSLIYSAVAIKAGVVERDEKESGERKVLNFGHTLAHALESLLGFDALYHGECVALGMLYMASPDVQRRLLGVYEKLGLPTKVEADTDQLIDICRHDKKCVSDRITVIYCAEIGSYEMKEITFAQLREMITKAVVK